MDFEVHYISTWVVDIVENNSERLARKCLFWNLWSLSTLLGVERHQSPKIARRSQGSGMIVAGIGKPWPWPAAAAVPWLLVVRSENGGGLSERWASVGNPEPFQKYAVFSALPRLCEQGGTEPEMLLVKIFEINYKVHVHAVFDLSHFT